MKIARYSLFMIVVAALVLGCSDSPDAASEATADMAMDRNEALGPLAVEGVEATVSTLVEDIVASGLIRGEREVNLVSETQGVIQQVGYELGDRVTTGQVLVRLDDSIQLLAVEEARESVSAAASNVASTERLVSAGNASQATLSQARGALAGARARLAQAQKALADRTLVAPFDGFIASKDLSIESGNFLNIGVPVARIIKMDLLEVRLSVGEREVQYLAPGSVAYVTYPGTDGEEIEARVAAIAAGSDPQTGSFPVIVRWDNPNVAMARAGMSVSVRIPPVGADQQVVVPANAVITRGAETSVFVARADGTAERRIVETGERRGDRQAIRSGVDSGEIVIVSGLRSLSNGEDIAVTDRNALGGSQ
jgi:membrane fusion protein (multidrug efflux system)